MSTDLKTPLPAFDLCLGQVNNTDLLETNMNRKTALKLAVVAKMAAVSLLASVAIEVSAATLHFVGLPA